MALKSFKVETDDRGITVVTFDRPPVNAVSLDVYPEFPELAETIQANDDCRVVVLVASPRCRAWCGGADVKNFLAMDYDASMAKYDLINRCMPHIYNLNRPIIAAINGHAVGLGLVLASFCDIRVASEEAVFGWPEIDRGVLSAGSAFLTRLGMPQGKIREMVFTGRRFTAEELRDTGLFNYIVPKDQVMPKAMEIAEIIAHKNLPALIANKVCTNAGERKSWEEGFKLTQKFSSELTSRPDAKEGVHAFLQKRDPAYKNG